jgi:hypothetical protein
MPSSLSVIDISIDGSISVAGRYAKWKQSILKADQSCQCRIMMHEQPLYCGIEGEDDGLGFMVHLIVIVIVTSNSEGGTAAVTRGILFGANS